MAKQGQKLDDELKERIRAALVLTNNKNEIAKSLGVSWATVDKVAKECTDAPEKEEQFEKLREEKKSQLIDKIWANIEDAIELGHSMVKEAKQGRRDIPLAQVSTYIGTLYDKQALMVGDPTQNVGGGLVIQIGIPDTAEG